MSERTCEYCEEPFRPNTPAQRFCGKSCSTKSYKSAGYAESLAKGEKLCSECEEVKPLEEFHRRRTSAGRVGWAHRCKTCASAASAARNATESVRRRNRELKLSRRYGITLVEYEQLLADQKSQCAICDRAHDDEAPLHVDHCHTTGRVRGLLCRPCNNAIGHFGEDLARMQRAIAYLERKRSS